MRISMRGLAITLVACSSAASALAQDARSPGSGILCAYTVYAGALLDAKLCGWEMTPQGKAVSKAVADLESYMQANLADPDRLEVFRGNFAAGLAFMRADSDEALELYCQGMNPERPNYFGGLRFEDPAQIDVSELVSRPGEPTYGDCF